MKNYKITTDKKVWKDEFDGTETIIPIIKIEINQLGSVPFDRMSEFLKRFYNEFLVFESEFIGTIDLKQESHIVRRIKDKNHFPVKDFLFISSVIELTVINVKYVKDTESIVHEEFKRLLQKTKIEELG